MIGTVDEALRALIGVPVSASLTGDRKEILAWVDTAFNGGLVIPRKWIVELGLPQQSSAEAILADGQLVVLETYACFFDWFGNTYKTQIVTSDAEYALLGTMLLEGRRLEIDYAQKSLQLA
jgi:clan AA aspartic protease